MSIQKKMPVKKVSLKKSPRSRKLSDMYFNPTVALDLITKGFRSHNVPKLVSLLIARLPERSRTILITAQLGSMKEAAAGRIASKFCNAKKRSKRKEYLMQLGKQAEGAGMKLKRTRKK